MAKRTPKLRPKRTPRNPLAEVFGFPIKDKSERALYYQTNKFCPFNNIVPSCTKVSLIDPLGVCSLYDRDGEPTVICPVRFKEDWLITAHAANFFFPPKTQWTAMPEVRLSDADGKAVGNIDLVLVAYDDDGYVMDFGVLEIQAAYISGNLRRPFKAYMKDLGQTTFDWSGQKEYPRADYLSSSRKRLAPQLIYKGGILHTWKKKMAVVIDRKFFESLPKFREVKQEEAEIAWLIYDLRLDETKNRRTFDWHYTTYTKFDAILEEAANLYVINEQGFIRQLEERLIQRNCSLSM